MQDKPPKKTSVLVIAKLDLPRFAGKIHLQFPTLGSKEMQSRV